MLNVCCGVPVMIAFAILFTHRWRRGNVTSRTFFAVATVFGAFVLLAVYGEGRYIVLTEGLVEAGCEGDAAQTERLIAWGANPNEPTDEEGLAPPCAVGNGHVEAARVLPRHGADSNRYGFFGYPAEEAKASDDPAMRRLFGLGPKAKR